RCCTPTPPRCRTLTRRLRSARCPARCGCTSATASNPCNVFDFCRDHSAQGIDAFLQAKDYHGYVNADALNVYDHLFASGAIIEVGCWAHCRRKFYEAKESDPARAHLVLARIRQL